MRDLTINPKFRDLIPPLDDHELLQLHKSLQEEGGARDPLVVWKGKDILLDGHNRYAYCTERGLTYEVREIVVEDECAAVNWIILNQLGRRNVSPVQAALLRGKLYQSRKKEHGATLMVGAESPKGQNDPSGNTAAAVAKETGVSEATVKRDAKVAAKAQEMGLDKVIMQGTPEESKAAHKQVKQALKEEKRPDAPPAYSAPEIDWSKNTKSGILDTIEENPDVNKESDSLYSAKLSVGRLSKRDLNKFTQWFNEQYNNN